MKLSSLSPVAPSKVRTTPGDITSCPIRQIITALIWWRWQKKSCHDSIHDIFILEPWNKPRLKIPLLLPSSGWIFFTPRCCSCTWYSNAKWHHCWMRSYCSPIWNTFNHIELLSPLYWSELKGRYKTNEISAVTTTWYIYCSLNDHPHLKKIWIFLI